MIFKIHYGLWYAGLVGIMPFMFNYAAEYSSASATQHGVLYTILPFIALVAKPLVCSLTDRYMCHRQALIFFILTTLIGYGSLAIYPFFPNFIRDNRDLIWSLYCVAALIGNTSMCIVNSLGDSLAINSCKLKNKTYGEYRMWGPVGFGLFGFVWGFANEIPTLPKYTPGIITLVFTHLLNVVFILCWYDKSEFIIHNTPSDNKGRQPIEDTNNINDRPQRNFSASNGQSGDYGSTAPIRSNDGRTKEGRIGLELNSSINSGLNIEEDAAGTTMKLPTRHNLQFNLIYQLLRKYPSICVYLLFFTICGALTAIHWQFFFRYLEQTAQQKKESFSLIATLVLPVQSLGGELIFFFFSGQILKKIGPSLTMTVCFFSFSARYLAYAYLIPYVNLYWVLLIELLQGPAFGLMYCVLTHQAQLYSTYINDAFLSYSVQFRAHRDQNCAFNTNIDPAFDKSGTKKSLIATLQGVLGAAFEGLGLGLGAIIGGRSFDVEPNLMWKIAGFFALIVAVLSLLIDIITEKFKNKLPLSSSRMIEISGN